MYSKHIAYRMKLIFLNNYKFIKILPVSSFFHIVIFTYYEESVFITPTLLTNFHKLIIGHISIYMITI